MFCIFTPISLYPLNLSTSKAASNSLLAEHGFSSPTLFSDLVNAVNLFAVPPLLTRIAQRITELGWSALLGPDLATRLDS